MTTLIRNQTLVFSILQGSDLGTYFIILEWNICTWFKLWLGFCQSKWSGFWGYLTAGEIMFFAPHDCLSHPFAFPRSNMFIWQEAAGGPGRLGRRSYWFMLSCYSQLLLQVLILRIMDNPSIYFHAYMHIPDFQNQSLGLSSTQDLQFLISEPPSSLWGCIFFLFTLLAPTFSLAAVGEKGVERTPVRIFMISLPSSKNINFKAWVIKEWPDSVWSCQGSVPFISSDGHFSSLRSIYYGSG